MVRQMSAFFVALAVAVGGVAQAQDQAQAPRPVRVGGAIKAPTKIKNVAPVYPEQALKEGIEGVVILELLISETGAVQEAKVLRSVPLLDEAALEAVLQWVYEPTFLNGQAVPIYYNITVAFSLKSAAAAAVTPPPVTVLNTPPRGAIDATATASSEMYKTAVRVGGVIRAPTRLVNVPPVVTPALLQQGQGVVILELLIAPEGHVQEIRVLRGFPHLNQAAIDAVKQWVYAPTLLNGVPTAVIYNITVAFTATP